MTKNKNGNEKGRVWLNLSTYGATDVALDALREDMFCCSVGKGICHQHP